MFIIKLLYGPAIFRNSTKSKLKTQVHINAHTQIFIVFLRIAKRYKQSKYLSTNEYINRIQFIHIRTLFSHKSVGSIDPCLARMNIENIISKTNKKIQTLHDFICIQCSKQASSQGQKLDYWLLSRRGMCRGTANRYIIPFEGVKNSELVEMVPS